MGLPCLCDDCVRTYLHMNITNVCFSSSSALSTARIEELIQEDQNVKRRRERYQKQSSLLSKLTRHLSIHDNRASVASSWSDGDNVSGILSLISACLNMMIIRDVSPENSLVINSS